MTDVSGSSSSSSSSGGSLAFSGPLSGSTGSTSSTGTMTAGFPAYRGLEFEESEALKSVLNTFSVPDQRGNWIKVATWFRDPEREDRNVTYPYIIIDYIGMYNRTNEEHRGQARYWYEPNTANELPQGDSASYGFLPIPIMLRYQVTTAARYMQHSVMINDLLFTSVLPPRFGQLATASGTIRRLDVITPMAPADSLDSDGKRLFRRVWTIEVSSELVPPYSTAPLVDEVVLETQLNGQLTETSSQEFSSDAGSSYDSGVDYDIV